MILKSHLLITSLYGDFIYFLYKRDIIGDKILLGIIGIGDFILGILYTTPSLQSTLHENSIFYYSFIYLCICFFVKYTS